MKVEQARVNDLYVDPDNAKQHTREQIEQIANSIDAFGFNDPVGVWHDADGRAFVVEGHGRLAAASLLGMEEVPIVALDHMSDDERRAYGIVHNSVSLASGLDPNAVAVELEKISDIDMSLFGFPDPLDMQGLTDEFSLPDADGPQVKTMTTHPTAEQLARIEEILAKMSRDECQISGPTEKGDKLCQAAVERLSAAT